MGSDRNTRARIGVAGIMDRETIAALSRGGIADITTIGRKSGAERRIEIYFHALDGRLFLTGRPGSKRDWMANLLANPSFTLHLKRGVSADVPVEAVPVHDQAERRRIMLRALTESWGSTPEKAEAAIEHWLDQAPLIEFRVSGAESG
jgi:deazaflavin-dependent oxidoreductase (nitroreductase family)